MKFWVSINLNNYLELKLAVINTEWAKLVESIFAVRHLLKCCQLAYILALVITARHNGFLGCQSVSGRHDSLRCGRPVLSQRRVHASQMSKRAENRGILPDGAFMVRVGPTRRD